MGQIGVITEQNDLGLNFDVLSAEDQKKYAQSTNKDNQSNKDKDEKK